jgi:hypothetical protein
VRYRGPNGNNATAIFAALALIAFVALYGYLIYAAISGFAPSRIDNELANTLIAGLAGLVGGVVTVAIGMSSPTTSPQATVRTQQPHAAQALTEETRQRARAILIWAYLICYIAMGALAIVTAIVWADQASEPIRNLAGIFVGLALPAARGFFS